MVRYCHSNSRSHMITFSYSQDLPSIHGVSPSSPFGWPYLVGSRQPPSCSWAQWGFWAAYSRQLLVVDLSCAARLGCLVKHGINLQKNQNPSRSLLWKIQQTKTWKVGYAVYGSKPLCFFVMFTSRWQWNFRSWIYSRQSSFPSPSS